MSRIAEALERSRTGSSRASENIGTVGVFPGERHADGDLLPSARGVGRHESTTVIAAPRMRQPVEDHFRPLSGDRLLVSPEIAWTVTEQYRRLAAELQSMQARSAWNGDAADARALKTLLIASALPREGRTLTAVNLALALSEFFGRRVLLIDADLRRPSVHHLLDISNTFGLVDALRSVTALPTLRNVSPLFSVLTAGEDTTHVELTFDELRSVIDRVVSQFDWVLVDSPPVVDAPRVDDLVRATRAVLFVIRSESTRRIAAEAAILRIGRAGIIGTVLNRMDSASFLNDQRG